MKAIQSLVLMAVVLGTTACASNAVKHSSGAAPGSASPTPTTLVVPAEQSSATTLAIQSMPPAGIGADAHGVATHSGFAANAATVPTLPAEPTAAKKVASSVEEDAEALYSQPPVQDPWEGFNRKMHGFNNVLDRFVLRPVAIGYDKITPDPVQAGVSRVFSNLRLPATAINQALQGRPGDAGQSLGRFVVNSTAGIAGVFDPARYIGMPKPDSEDLGQTLATWGWRDSRYLVMPIMGPRTVRDALGGFGDQQLSLINQINSSSVADKLQIMQMVDVRAQLLPMDQMRKEAFDDYAFVRDGWAQQRNRQIEQDLRSSRD